MKRRQFIAGLAGAVGWPVTARAQQSRTPVVGFLHAAAPTSAAGQRDAFHKGLREFGYVVGQNLTLEYRWAEGRYERLPALAAELLERDVALIVAGGGSLPALAAKAATPTIPIVFVSGEDPVKHKLVSSINRPGGNVTGATFLSNDLSPSRLGVLRELLTPTASIAFLVNPTNPDNEAEIEKFQVMAGAQFRNVFRASNERDLEPIFEAMTKQSTNAVVVASDTFFVVQRGSLVALAARHALPTIFPVREFVVAGGLISYGASIPEAYRQAGLYVARILKGEKPAELPVVQPTKFELAINLKTAKALGLTIPPSLLTRADEVIE